MSHHDHKVIIRYLIMEIAMYTSRGSPQSLNIIAKLVHTLHIIVPHISEECLQAIKKSALI